MQETISDSGVFETPNASRYLQQLCKHFAHKIEVRFDPARAELALPTGPARLFAEDGVLRAEITGRSVDDLARARGIIDRHLERFAFRENFTAMTWQTGPGG